MIKSCVTVIEIIIIIKVYPSILHDEMPFKIILRLLFQIIMYCQNILVTTRFRKQFSFKNLKSVYYYASVVVVVLVL